MRVLHYMNENELNELSNNIQIQNRGTLTVIATADIHFGVVDPKKEYDILCEQMLKKIENLPFDIFTVNGDLFDHKMMSNNDAVMYAILFIDRIVDLCKKNNATLFLIDGTTSHEADQLKLFYHYLDDPSIDVRIIEDIRFEYCKNATILCIPERYGMGEDYYKIMFSQHYDMCFGHGTFEGSVFNLNPKGLDSDREVTFKFNDFSCCKGPIFFGHVHTPGTYKKYVYYSGTPIRYKFGEEEDKGFLISLINLDTSEHYTHFEEIKSFRYDTINVDHLLLGDPQKVIEYVSQLKSQGIDHIRLEINNINDNNVANYNIINNYYRSSNTVKIKSNYSEKKKILEENKENSELYDQYNYILDNGLSAEEIFVKYVNQQKGYDYISTDDLLDILNEL